MFEVLKHLSALTGLSVSVIVVALVLGWLDPMVRRLAIIVAILTTLAYAEGLYVYHLGSADKQAEWDDANERQTKAAVTRDNTINAAIATPYDLKITELEQQNAAHQQQIAQYEKMLVAAKSGSCPLGSAALRLRQRPH